MVTKEQLLQTLPVRGETVITTEKRQNTDDIRADLLSAHNDYAKDYDLISDYFNKGDIIETSREIFDFLKYNVPYRKESGQYQTIKNPRAILTCNDGSTPYDRIDCKNYASFIAGIIDSLKRKYGGSWSWTYRFASYNPNDKEPGHVFVVVTTDAGELWIDPVFDYFNGGDMPEWELDEKPSHSIGGLYRVIAGPTDQTDTITVNGSVAWTSFLLMVQNDILSIRYLLTAYPQITQTKLRAWCQSMGYDYDQLIRFIVYSKI